MFSYSWISVLVPLGSDTLCKSSHILVSYIPNTCCACTLDLIHEFFELRIVHKITTKLAS